MKKNIALGILVFSVAWQAHAIIKPFSTTELAGRGQVNSFSDRFEILFEESPAREMYETLSDAGILRSNGGSKGLAIKSGRNILCWKHRTGLADAFSCALSFEKSSKNVLGVKEWFKVRRGELSVQAPERALNQLPGRIGRGSESISKLDPVSLFLHPQELEYLLGMAQIRLHGEGARALFESIPGTTKKTELGRYEIEIKEAGDLLCLRQYGIGLKTSGTYICAVRLLDAAAGALGSR